MNSETAINFLRKVDHEAAKLGESTADLEQGFVALGYAVLEVSETRCWKIHYERFRDYLADLAPKCGKTPDQLQRYFLTVRDLIDTFTKDQMHGMGITKAMRVRAAKDYALVLPNDVFDAAINPEVTSKELKKIISTSLKMPTDEPGDWMDCEFEFMVTPEQRATIEAAIQAAIHTDPLIKPNISKSAQMLEVMLRLSMEYLGAGHGETSESR